MRTTPLLLLTFQLITSPERGLVRNQKRANMTQASRHLSTFSAMVFETLGAVNDEGEEAISLRSQAPWPRVLLLIVAEPGLECRAICNGLFRKLFRIAL